MSPSVLPVGAPQHRPLVDVCVVHRWPEIMEQECAMELALVVVIRGTRLPV
jgi:hypothetical protein